MPEITTAPVGETIEDDSAVHIDSEGNAYKAVLPDKPAIGYCITGASSGSVQVVLSGNVPASLEAVNGAFVYLDNDTPGAISSVKPSGIFQVIGRINEGFLMVEVSQSKISELNPAAVAYFQ